MTTCYTYCRCSMDIVIPIGIYCYFGFIKYSESCEVSNNKTQSVNKRYLNMSSLFYVGERRYILAYRLHIVNLCEQEILQCFLIWER